jgi:hypothetical protein
MMSYKDAKGPTYARYLCSTLWDSEQYFMQIDSHTEFIKNWDTTCINMLESCRYTDEPENEFKYNKNGSLNPVLATYPLDKSQKDVKGYVIIDEYKLDKDKPIMLFSHVINEEHKKPIKSIYNLTGANFIFCDYTILIDVPFDPYLGFLFQSEEYLLSARLYSNNYQIYVPQKTICFHSYKRKGTFYWDDNKKMYNKCIKIAHKRVKDILSGSIKDQYSLGPRSLDDFAKDIKIRKD